LIFHAEVTAAVADQLVGFNEGAFVKQQVDALPRRELALGVLPGSTLFATASLRAGVASAEFIEAVGHKKLA
jgi:hypothetical protein